MPYKPGDNPESSFGLRGEILEISSNTAVIHITAYGDDPEFRQYGNRRASASPERWCVVPKDGDWAPRVVQELPRALHTHRIRQRLATLLSPIDSVPDRQLSAARPVAGCDRARSLDLSEVCVDASTHWDLLYPTLQADLKKAFGYTFDQTTNSHRLGVIESDAGQARDHKSNAE